ncbi:Adhesion G-protein coupled receptor D1 [Bulinus truncatus]|nr:Adhesion G-protein coupled receptor D1 [Bulinus truncatus]
MMDVVGGLVDIVGFVMDVVGGLVDIIGCVMDVVGGLVDIVGWMMDFVGGLMDIVGWVMDVVGGLVDIVGFVLDIVGGFVDIVGCVMDDADLRHHWAMCHSKIDPLWGSGNAGIFSIKTTTPHTLSGTKASASAIGVIDTNLKPEVYLVWVSQSATDPHNYSSSFTNCSGIEPRCLGRHSFICEYTLAHSYDEKTELTLYHCAHSKTDVREGMDGPAIIKDISSTSSETDTADLELLKKLRKKHIQAILHLPGNETEINIAVLLNVVRAIQSSVSMMDENMSSRSKSFLRTLLILTPLFGLTWVFGVLSLSGDSMVFQYLFAALNSLQGLFILIFQCAIRKQVREGFRNWRRSTHSSSLKKNTLHGGKTLVNFSILPLWSICPNCCL